MAKQVEEAEVFRRVLQVLLQQGLCYGDEETVEIRLSELAEHLAPEFGASTQEMQEKIEVALDRHPEILSKRVHQGTVIYETTMGACREAASQRTSS